jgi:hypothetical protein
LKFMAISPENYWIEISEWLYSKDKARWIHAKS